MKIISVIGARPNFMKIAPFIHEINKYNKSITLNSHYINHLLIHTGQHYDDRMSNQFLTELEIPEPDINLGVGSGSHGEQIGRTMIEFEKILKNNKPDWVVVVGDVNATLACTVIAKKENIKCCHIEAGLRSGDMSMPEEINRLVTDRLSDLLLTPDQNSSSNLLKEGVPEQKIRFVGNIMIDTLEENRAKVLSIPLKDILTRNLFRINQPIPEILENKFVVLTLHRPSNVDNKEIFSALVNFIIKEIAIDMPLIWPIHPRALKQLGTFGLEEKLRKEANIILLHPLSYNDMLRLNMCAKAILTDSGGLQEECTILGTPCITLRRNTERPITLRENGGASVLVGNNLEEICHEYRNALKLSRNPVRPLFWDGHSAKRCLNAILNYDI